MQSSTAGSTRRCGPRLEAGRAVAAAAAAEQDLALAGGGVDALLQGGAQLVGVVVQGALEELDLVRPGSTALDLVAQHLAADDLGRRRP